MAKEQRKRPKISFEGFDQDTGLPTPEGAVKTVADVTGQPIKKPFSAADLKATRKPRSPQTAEGRVKFTTMLRPDLRDQLDTLAAARGITIAAALEIILEDFLANLKK